MASWWQDRAVQLKLQLLGRFLLIVLCTPLLPFILVRRWLRCHRKLPSNECCGPSEIGRPVEPTMQGLHRRFVELYGSESSDNNKSSGFSPGHFEAAAMTMQKRLTLKDGQEIAYWDLGPSDAKEVVILCQGLGARIAGWVPLLDALCSGTGGSQVPWRQRRLVIPEYRGQFASIPLVGGPVSVEQGAKDVASVAAALGIKAATLLCWSTGVQVGLQLTLDEPDLVRAMVLIQGFNGRMCSCLLQPICSLPGMSSLLSYALGKLPKYISGDLRKTIYDFFAREVDMLEKIGSWVVWFFGSDFMPAIGVRYAQDMIQSDAHFAHYCGYAVALDRHDVSARLGEIKAPALVVTGTPDFVTPARCSYDIAAKLGGQTQLIDDFGASHYFILEEPHKLAGMIGTFLNQNVTSSK